MLDKGIKCRLHSSTICHIKVYCDQVKNPRKEEKKGGKNDSFKPIKVYLDAVSRGGKMALGRLRVDAGHEECDKERLLSSRRNFEGGSKTCLSGTGG